MAGPEIWRDVPDFEGMYQVSNKGRVKSLDRIVIGRFGPTRRRGRILKGGLDKDGYSLMVFSKNGKHTTAKVHRLVASMFLPIPENKTQVNHKDGDKLNNSVENLEWCDAKENINHSFRLGLNKAKPLNWETSAKPVHQFDLNGKHVRTFPSLSEAKRVTGITQAQISRCCYNENYTTHGFKWRFADGARKTVRNKNTKIIN